MMNEYLIVFLVSKYTKNQDDLKNILSLNNRIRSILYSHLDYFKLIYINMINKDYVYEFEQYSEIIQKCIKSDESQKFMNMLVISHNVAKLDKFHYNSTYLYINDTKDANNINIMRYIIDYSLNNKYITLDFKTNMEYMAEFVCFDNPNHFDITLCYNMLYFYTESQIYKFREEDKNFYNSVKYGELVKFLLSYYIDNFIDVDTLYDIQDIDVFLSNGILLFLLKIHVLYYNTNTGIIFRRTICEKLGMYDPLMIRTIKLFSAIMIYTTRFVIQTKNICIRE